MATYTDFSGIISNFGSVGAPISFKANVFGLTLQSSVQLSSKDIQTILDGVWQYHKRTLTENSGGLTQEEHDHLMLIPENPVLDSDARLNNLDTTISSRASQTSVNAIPTNPVLENDSRLGNLDVPVSSRKPDVVDFTDEDREKLDTVLKIEKGGRIIENNEMAYFDGKTDTGTEVVRFKLYDKNGNPTETNVFRREPV